MLFQPIRSKDTADRKLIPAWTWKSLMEEVRKGILSSSWFARASCKSSLKHRITPMIVILCNTLSTFCSLLNSSWIEQVVKNYINDWFTFMISGLSKFVLSAIKISLFSRTSFLNSVTWLWMCHISVSLRSLIPVIHKLIKFIIKYINKLYHMDPATPPETWVHLDQWTPLHWMVLLPQLSETRMIAECCWKY